MRAFLYKHHIQQHTQVQLESEWNLRALTNMKHRSSNWLWIEEALE